MDEFAPRAKGAAGPKASGDDDDDDDAKSIRTTTTVYTSAVRGARSVIAGGGASGGAGGVSALTPTRETTRLPAICYKENRLGKAGARWVDTPEALAQMLEAIEALPEGALDVLAFDAEWGAPLEVATTLSTVQLRPGKSGTAAYVVDVTTLGATVFETATASGRTSLRRLLEDTATTTKLMVDPRCDAALLWRIYGVKLARVVDVQVGFYAHRCLVRGIDPHMPSGTTIIESVLRFGGANPRRTTQFMRVVEVAAKRLYRDDVAIWDRRPLPPLLRMYAALDVMYLTRVWAAIIKLLNKTDVAGCRPTDIVNWIHKASDDRVEHGRSGAYAPSPASSLAPPFTPLLYTTTAQRDSLSPTSLC